MFALRTFLHFSVGFVCPHISNIWLTRPPTYETLGTLGYINTLNVWPKLVWFLVSLLLFNHSNHWDLLKVKNRLQLEPLRWIIYYLLFTILKLWMMHLPDVHDGSVTCFSRSVQSVLSTYIYQVQAILLLSSFGCNNVFIYCNLHIPDKQPSSSHLKRRLPDVPSLPCQEECEWEFLILDPDHRFLILILILINYHLHIPMTNPHNFIMLEEATRCVLRQQCRWEAICHCHCFCLCNCLCLRLCP